MKVLKKAEYLREVTCTGRGNGLGGCGSLLGVNREDMRYYEGGGYFDRDPAVVIRCPVCSSLTDLHKVAWPQNVKGLKGFTSYWKKTGKDPAID